MNTWVKQKTKESGHLPLYSIETRNFVSVLPMHFHCIVIRHVGIFTITDDLHKLSWHNMISIVTGINIHRIC